MIPLKLPPNGGDLWVELQPGDVVDGPVEERVDGRGKRWLGTTHKLQRGRPLLLDPKRRHATTPWTCSAGSLHCKHLRQGARV